MSNITMYRDYTTGDNNFAVIFIVLYRIRVSLICAKRIPPVNNNLYFFAASEKFRRIVENRL